MKTLLTILTLVASLAYAQAAAFTTSLTAAQDGGGARTGSGSGTLTLTGNNLAFNNILYSGLSGTVTLAHIHGPGAPGVAAGVIYNLIPTFTAMGANSGAFNGTLTLVDGTAGITLANQLSQLNGGQWYFNIHTTAFGGGEIRGQIVPVPEPGTWALGSLGLVGMMVWMRRRAA